MHILAFCHLGVSHVSPLWSYKGRPGVGSKEGFLHFLQPGEDEMTDAQPSQLNDRNILILHIESNQEGKKQQYLSSQL